MYHFMELHGNSLTGYIFKGHQLGASWNQEVMGVMVVSGIARGVETPETCSYRMNSCSTWYVQWSWNLLLSQCSSQLSFTSTVRRKHGCDSISATESTSQPKTLKARERSSWALRPDLILGNIMTIQHPVSPILTPDDSTVERVG